MSTILQQNLAKELIDNATRKKPKNKKDMLVSVGYKQSVAETKPQEIIEQKGVKEALKSYGLTERLIKTALVNDIKKKPKNRVSELRLASEILNLNSKENETVRPVNIIIPLQVAQSFNINGTDTKTSGSNPE